MASEQQRGTEKAAIMFHKKVSPSDQKLLRSSTPVHPEDQRLVDDGFHPEVAKALRNRREKHFANKIQGPVGDKGSLKT